MKADVQDAVEDAVAEMAGRGGVVLVTGSLQTAAGYLAPLHENRYRGGSAQGADTKSL